MNVTFIFVGIALVVIGGLAPTIVPAIVPNGSVVQYVLIVLGALAVIFGVFKKKSHRFH
jgi:hypothetical protein